jgi:hypothetical protein
MYHRLSLSDFSVINDQLGRLFFLPRSAAGDRKSDL